MGTSLLALLDDISMILDDVVLLSKMASRKTAGVLGDDLALNAEQVSGVRADRELPVVWAVAKGSLVNKAIIVPTAFVISLVVPWLIKPLLLVGGSFLAYEGTHKVTHKLLHGSDEKESRREHLTAALANPETDLVALERDKIKGAVRTDFVLSAEIIVITLGTVAQAPVITRLAVLTVVAIIMTVGVYGLVAGIVRLDNLGQDLIAHESSLARSTGKAILAFAPRLMKFLAFAGTAAMFLVGGGIVTHTFGFLHHTSAALAAWARTVSTLGPALAFVLPPLFDALVGFITGAIVLFAVTVISRFRAKKTPPTVTVTVPTPATTPATTETPPTESSQ